MAISAGKAVFAKNWDFDNDNTILIGITRKLEILLSYTNGKLEAEYEQSKQNKNLEDF